MEYGVTEKGFVSMLYPDILKEIEDDLKIKFGQEWELDLYTPEGAMAMVFSDKLAKAWEGAKQAYFSKFLDYSTGIQLDYHGKSEEPPVIRGKGNYATTTVEFVTNREMAIPKWTLLKKRGTEATYMTVSTLKIDKTLKGQVQAIATGSGDIYNAIIGDISELGNNITGVISVSNITPATGGDGIENDSSYRERIRRNRRNQGGSTVNTITSELLKLKTINNALVLENVTDEIDENGLKPGYIRVYIDGIDSEEVSKTIHGFKSAGINTEGDRGYEVENSGGQLVRENFYMMTKRQLYVTVEIISYADGEVPDSIKTAIKEVVKSYIEEIQQTGLNTKTKRIVINQLEARAYAVSDEILEVSAKAGLSSSPTEKKNINIPVGEYFYCDSSTIEVI